MDLRPDSTKEKVHLKAENSHVLCVWNRSEGIQVPLNPKTTEWFSPVVCSQHLSTSHAKNAWYHTGICMSLPCEIRLLLPLNDIHITVI